MVDSADSTGRGGATTYSETKQSTSSVEAALEAGSEAHDAQQHEQLMQLLENEQVSCGKLPCNPDAM